LLEIEPDRILIVKLSAIGDVVHTLPFLEVLAERFPLAKIDWLVEEESSAVPDGHPALNRLIVSKRRSWQADFILNGGRKTVLAEAAGFVRDLRSIRYDVVVDLQGLFKSAVLTWLARGGLKVGPSGGRECSWIVLNRPPVPVDYHWHAIDRYLEVAHFMGCRTNRWTGRIPVGPEDRAGAAAILREQGLEGAPLVAINPMARWKTKLWVPDRFSILADRISQELGASVAFTGSPGDRPWIERIRNQCCTRPVNLAGLTTLKQLAEIYARCSVVVSTDTGPMHIAAAMGCPVVALFGPTAPWRTGPYGAGHRVVREPVECSPCFRKSCSSKRCMEAITPEVVLQEVQGLLERNPGPEQRGEDLVRGLQSHVEFR
jgi:3-deoxy-D-manno-octulosonic-acid transferase/heptosyltransferase-1